jgi:hypothetical protein
MSPEHRLFLVIFGLIIVTVIMTLRAIYGLFAWRGQRKKALIQVISVPLVGLLMIIVVSIALPKPSADNASRANASAIPEGEPEATEREEIAADDEQEEVEVSATAVNNELEMCRQDLKCWAEKNEINAVVRCKREIERFAAYIMKWTNNGWIESEFSRYQWHNQNDGLIAYIGDKAQFQNGFGAWENVIYYCVYDPATDRAVNVEVAPGRLP